MIGFDDEYYESIDGTQVDITIDEYKRVTINDRYGAIATLDKEEATALKKFLEDKGY